MIPTSTQRPPSQPSSRSTAVSWSLQPMLEALPHAAGPKTVEQLARDIITWLRASGLCRPDSRGRLHLTPWLDVRLDDAEGAIRLQALRTACPQLSSFEARKLGAVLIERAHAERADSMAVQNGLENQLARVLELLRRKQPLVSARVPTGAPHLLNLRAPHYDGCLFDPNAPIDRGGQGTFHVGITTHKHAVAIKQLLPKRDGHSGNGRSDLDQAAFAREASATRRSSRYDILQLYSTPRHQFMVMPLFNGDLRQHASAFLRLHAPPEAPGGQGLFGARYLLRQLVGEVAYLHRDRRLIHQDIKANNIFLRHDRRQFVLGDLGMASAIDEFGRARPRGYTPTLAAPEQSGGAKVIGPEVDIFGVATTLFGLLTTHCPPVMAYRHKKFPGQSAPGLFPYLDRVTQMHEAHRRLVFAALDGTRSHFSKDALTEDQSEHQAHFESIHRSVNHFDQPLGNLLRLMLQHDPMYRPPADKLLIWMDDDMALHASNRAQIDAAWENDVPRFSAPILSALDELHTAMDTLATTAHRSSSR